MVTFLSVDAGTTSIKAALFDASGKLLALDRQEYQLLTPAPSYVEMDPETYWESFLLATRNVLERSGVNPEEIATLCISSQGETIIAVDPNGEPVYQAIVWLDNRAVDQALEISTHFGIEAVFSHTGQPEVSPGWPACKILWLRQREPEIFSKTAKFLLLEDYLIFRLTGQYVTDLSLQTSSLMLEITSKHWWEEMLTYLGISESKLGRLVESGCNVGPLRSETALSIGLSASTAVVSGGMDQALGALGAGNIAPGMVSEMTGGALALMASLKTPYFHPQRKLPCQFHAIPDTYCLMPFGTTGGMALKWFRDEFFSLEAENERAHRRDPYDLMTRLAAGVPAGCNGLVMLPHLEGAYCPEFNPAARAVFFGATLRHTRAHFIRAILEAVSFMLKRNIELLESTGMQISEVRSLGGGARNPFWLQMKADVLQKPILTIQTEETACLGAAILGAAASQTYPDLSTAVRKMVTLSQAYSPNPAYGDIYLEQYRKYIDLYSYLTPLFR